MKSILVVCLLVKFSVASPFSETCNCSDVDVLRNLDVAGLGGVWFIQHMFFGNLLPDFCRNGVYNIIRPTGCSTFDCFTVCDDTPEEHVSVVGFKKDSTEKNLAVFRDAKTNGKSSIVGFDKDKFLISYYCHVKDGKVVRQLYVATRSKFISDDVRVLIERVLKDFEVTSWEQGTTFRQRLEYPGAKSFVFSRKPFKEQPKKEEPTTSKPTTTTTAPPEVTTT